MFFSADESIGMKTARLLFLLFASAAALFGQAGKTDMFAPFVSRLRAVGGEHSVTLTWKGSTDLRASQLVFRCTQEISELNFAQAAPIASLGAGTESYVDYPPDQKTYFYAVLLQDEQKKLYQLFIPFRNITSAGAAIQSLAPEEDLAARITGLQAQRAADSVMVSFKSSKADRELLLFRSTSPMRAPEDLLSATSPVALEAGTTRYQDYPIPGVRYYYAVLDARLFKVGKTPLSAPDNTTLEAVQLPMGLGRIGLPVLSSIRPLPLPYLLLSSGVEHGEPLTPFASTPPRGKEDLKPATRRALAELLASAPQREAPRMEVEILPLDGAGSEGGEAYSLRAILQEELLKGDYRQAEELLAKFLSIRRGVEIEARAHFYLAQAFYFQGRIREAFLEFLLARDRYYLRVQSWLEACTFNLERGE